MNLEKWKELRAKKWLTCLLLIFGALGVGLLSLAFATVTNRWAMMACYFQRPLLLLLNLLPGVLLALFLWFLCGHATVAYGITAAVVFGLSMANWYKLQFRNDPLMFEDLLLAKEAGNMLGRYSLFMTPALAIALLLLLLGGVCLFFCARGKFQKGWRHFAMAGAVLLLCLPLSRLYTDGTIYSQYTENNELINRWAATQVYTSKGFVYPFLHSVTSAFDTPPEGYKAAEAKEILSAYASEDIPQDKRVNVVGVMLEAFNDFSKYEQIPFSKDVYADYHAMEQESYCGNLVTSIFAAGTVKTERSFVTGLNRLGSFRSPTNSYAWYFGEQGYTVTGSHPSRLWFYNRTNINPNLGFSSYKFLENYYQNITPDGGIAMDDVLFPELENLYDQAVTGSDTPYFSFSVTYQGHGPYGTEENKWGEDFIKPGVYSKATENIFNNYFGSIKSTSKELRSFLDFYRDREEPVVVVLFGDHSPWMGDGNSAYEEAKIDLNTSQKSGFLNYYSTRYLIWANDAAKKVLGNSFVGQGPDLSPNFLMNEVFKLCGWKGNAYMQYCDEVRKEIPVISETGACITKDGELLGEPGGQVKELLEQYRRVEYYQKKNFQYQDVLALQN